MAKARPSGKAARKSAGKPAGKAKRRPTGTARSAKIKATEAHRTPERNTRPASPPTRPVVKVAPPVELVPETPPPLPAPIASFTF